MSECTRTPHRSTSELTQAGLHTVVWLVLVKLELRRGFKSFYKESVAFVVGEIGSCDVLREHANVANVGRICV